MGSISERVARRAAFLKRADEMTPAEWKAYRKKHPDADQSKHKIVQPGQKGGKPESDGQTAPNKPGQTPKQPGKKPPPIPQGGKKKSPEQSKKPESKDKKKDKPHGSTGGWKTALKGLRDSAIKFVENAPNAVKSFLGDPDFRRSTLKEAKEAAVTLPKKAVHRLVETVKEEVKEFKEAGAGIKAVMNGKKMSRHQKHAFKAVATHLSIGAAAAAFAATGPLVGAAVFSKNLATHVALKSVKKALGSLHTMNEVNHIGHGVAHLFEHVASEGDDKNIDPEEAMTNLILAAVAKQIEQLTDEDFVYVLNNLEENKGSDNEKAQDKTAARMVVARYVTAVGVVRPPRRLVNLPGMVQALDRFEFVLQYTAWATRDRKGRELSGDMQIRKLTSGMWQVGMPGVGAIGAWEPPTTADRVYDRIRRTPLNFYVQEADKLRLEIWDEIDG